jgi:hypothetical protein
MEKPHRKDLGKFLEFSGLCAAVAEVGPGRYGYRPVRPRSPERRVSVEPDVSNKRTLTEIDPSSISSPSITANGFVKRSPRR